MKKLLVVLGHGGHTAQMIKLISSFNEQYNLEFVINKDDKMTPKKRPGVYYKMTRTRVMGKHLLKDLFRGIKNAFEALRIIMRSNPYAVISSGPGISIMLFFFAKLFGKKTIFIESWARVNQRSLSGRFCYYLSDKFFVQWTTLKKKYPKAIYAGRLA